MLITDIHNKVVLLQSNAIIRYEQYFIYHVFCAQLVVYCQELCAHGKKEDNYESVIYIYIMYKHFTSQQEVYSLISATKEIKSSFL